MWQAVFPVVTLIIGITLEFAKERYVRKKDKDDDFSVKRFSSLLFPLYINVEDYNGPSRTDAHYISEDYFVEKAKYASDILMKNSYYASPQMIHAYTIFAAELYDYIHEKIGNSIENVTSAFFNFSNIISNEYVALEEKLLKSVKCVDLFED